MHGCIFSDYSSVWICAREWDCWPSVCSFLRALHSVLHSGCTSLLPTSSGRGLLPPHPLQRLSFVDLFLAVLSLRSCPPAFLPLQGAGSTLQGRCAAFTLQGLSSCRERGPLSRDAVRPSHRRACPVAGRGVHSPGTLCGLRTAGLVQLQGAGSGARGLQCLWPTGFVAPGPVGSSGSRDGTCVSPLAGKFFTTEPPTKPLTLVDFVMMASLAGEPQPFLLKRILAIPPPGSRQHPVRSPISPHPPRSQLAARRGEGRVRRGAGQMDSAVTSWWRRQ